MSDLLSPETRERRRNMLRTAMGPAIALALDEPDVVEVLVNPDGRLWLDRHGSGRADTGVVLTPHEAERIICLVASHVRAEANGSSPIVSAELPETGERFEGLLPLVALAACFAIRKPAKTTFRLADYVKAQIASPVMAKILTAAVAEGRNILVAGGTGSGKTTLANALLAEVAGLDQRVVIIEDTRELRCDAKDAVALRTKPGVATLADLVRSTPEEARARATMAVRGALALTLACSVVMIVLAPVLCTTIFGSEFSGSVEMLRILALGSFGITTLKLLGNALTAQRRPLLETSAVAVAFVTVIVLDFLLIPNHGGIGASIASAASYTAGGIAAAVIFGRALGASANELVPRPGDLKFLIRSVSARFRPARPAPGE